MIRTSSHLLSLLDSFLIGLYIDVPCVPDGHCLHKDAFLFAMLDIANDIQPSADVQCVMIEPFQDMVHIDICDSGGS